MKMAAFKPLWGQLGPTSGATPAVHLQLPRPKRLSDEELSEFRVGFLLEYQTNSQQKDPQNSFGPGNLDRFGGLVDKCFRRNRSFMNLWYVLVIMGIRVSNFSYLYTLFVGKNGVWGSTWALRGLSIPSHLQKDLRKLEGRSHYVFGWAQVFFSRRLPLEKNTW